MESFLAKVMDFIMLPVLFVFMIGGAAMLCFLVYIVVEQEVNSECRLEIVRSVGGCGRHGTCGVVTDKGYGTANFPAEGGEVMVCRRVDNGPK